MIKRFKKFLLGDDIGFREQILRIVLTIGTIVLLIAIVEEIFVVGSNGPGFIALLIMLATMIAGGILAFYKKTEAAILLAGIVTIVFVFPIAFFMNGGVESGAAVWFVLGLFYVFLMYSGKKLVIFTIMTVVIDGAVYILAYLHPEDLQYLSSDATIYSDSFFAVVLVGISVGALLKYQGIQYNKEKKHVQQQAEELERMGQSRSQFFANVSHEIRTPINTIIGLNEVILRDEISEEVAENAMNIQNASKMLLSIVNDILDLSQMENHKMEIIPADYDTRAMFEELVDMIRVRMKEKDLGFVVNIDGDLPSTMRGDEKRIKQVILNLLTNAVKYTEKGEVTLSARGDLVGEEWLRLTVAVSDTGIGIQKVNLEHLFDTFARVDDKNAQKVEGTGLGLSICKQLVELMGGQITVDSVYTKGSTFTVIIEQQIIDSTPIGTVNFFVGGRENYRRHYRQSFEASEARVLVVDDNDMNRLVAQKLLAPTKVQIDLAASGAECLELTAKKRYQVILMDQLMSVMDGIETLNAVRRQDNGLCRDTPVVLMTANTMPGMGDVYEKYGFQGYLEKPVSSDRLEEEVLRFIPEDMLEYKIAAPVVNNFTGEVKSEGEGSQASQKRPAVRITTDCVCDMSDELLQNFDVDVMDLYIITDYGRFRDRKEITSDNLTQHLSHSRSTAKADSATVEEFEEFYARVLSEADEIVHISMASRSGRTYNIATQAARSFGHVHVVDSGHISGGQALVVMYAARLAKAGKNATEICAAIEQFSKHVHSAFLFPTLGVFYQRGYATHMLQKFSNQFGLHPILKTSNSLVHVVGFKGGSIEHAWRVFIRNFFVGRVRLDSSLVYVTYVGLSMRQQKFIENEIKKYGHFDEILFEPSSVSNACNSGLGSIGIACVHK